MHCTEIVLTHANKKKKPVFIASTSEVYGKGEKLPFREDGDLLLGPTDMGRWAYACSKALAVAAVCAATDVMVLTSDNEGTPVAFIEAQAAGLPVVGPHVGGMATVVEDGKTGRVIPQGDEEGLATAVRALLEDPAMSKRMGEAGQLRAFDRFGIDRLVDDVDALYHELLDHR